MWEHVEARDGTFYQGRLDDIWKTHASGALFDGTNGTFDFGFMFVGGCGIEMNTMGHG